MTTTTIHPTGTYGIDTGEGDQITAGVSGVEIARLAQELADQRGEPVYVYELGRTGDEDDPRALTVRPRR